MFAASDRPTIIYSASRKLLYSNLNENEVGRHSFFSIRVYLVCVWWWVGVAQVVNVVRALELHVAG